MLNYLSECLGVFVTDTEINGDKDAELTLIFFHHYENIISCSLHKQILPKHGKTCISCTNIEDFDKIKVTAQKSPVLKSCNTNRKSLVLK